MGDMPLLKNQMDVECALMVLSYCHKHEEIKDEVFCQIMKQTTNNKSEVPESAQKGWRLFSILAAYFTCSDSLKPFLFKYLETAAYDKRRAYHGTALVCLHNLRKTFKFGGRKNAPSIEEITAITAGRNSKRQIYRLVFSKIFLCFHNLFCLDYLEVQRELSTPSLPLLWMILLRTFVKLLE